MLKKIIYFSITVLISLVLLEGCYEDLGSYEYETVNQITIDLGNNGFLDQSLSQ